ncbi:MAG: hypothetical protein ABW060_02615 [Solirubrobacteraceae bacterium]
MRMPCAVLCSAGLLMAMATAGSASAQSPGTTRVVRPALDQVVGNGKLHVLVRTRARVRVEIDGRRVNRYLRRTRRGYRGVVRLGQGLRYGSNELSVTTRGHKDFDRVKFIVAKRRTNLVDMRALRVRGREAPARVVVAPAPRSRLQAWLNGRRVEHAFQPSGRRFVGRLGANDGVRPGRNRLVVLTHRTARRGRHAVYDVERETFWHKRGRVIAGAGRDRVFTSGSFVTLRGSARIAGDDVGHRWRIVSAPRGAQARLHGARTTRPELVATTPGTYRVRTRVTAPNGSSSADTATIDVREPVPPLGWQLRTTDDRGTIALDGKPVADTTWPCASGSDPDCAPYMSWAVINRRTAKVEESGNRIGDAAGLKLVADRIDARFKVSPFYLVVVNLSGSSAALPDGVRILKSLGVDTSQARPALKRPISVVGVPGSPAGSAFISDPRIQCAVSNPACPAAQPQGQANMTGYLRLNSSGGSGGWFEFVFGDQVAFDTDAAPASGKITMKVGTNTYESSVPADGSSGFVLLMLDSNTLVPNRPPQVFRSNNANGTENPDELVRMNALLNFSADPFNGHGEMLVMLQAFGKPYGNSGAWLKAAYALGRLGANEQMFVWLNQDVNLRPGETAKRGRYAFVARTAMQNPPAELSGSITQADARLSGILSRGRDARYEPLLADPAGTVNADLVRILNRPTAPNNGYPEWETPGEAAAADFLGRADQAIGVCPEDESAPCDVRRHYYETDLIWESIATKLDGNRVAQLCAAPHPDFAQKDCETVRDTFVEEIANRSIVAKYFGPEGLQGPFARYNVATSVALVDVPRISAEIRSGLPTIPPRTAANHAFTMLGYAAKIVGMSGDYCAPCAAVAGGLGGAFSVGAYLTEDNGTPDLIGPQVTTEATKLAGELYDRYQRASSYLATEAEIVMSDGSKMAEVARSVRRGGIWNVKPAAATGVLESGARQEIYKTLVPAAYPVLYNLGPGRDHAARGMGNARDWQCAGNVGYASRRLFQNTGDDAQLIWRNDEESSVYFGQRHFIAVGATNTIDSHDKAYIPGPPKALTDKLFANADAPTVDGIGLNKLEFYSTQYFTLFPKVFRMDDATGWTFCGRMPNPPGPGGGMP